MIPYLKFSFSNNWSLGCYAIKNVFLKGKIANYKTHVCKISKNVSAKLYHIESSKTRGQIVDLGYL